VKAGMEKAAALCSQRGSRILVESREEKKNVSYRELV